MLLLLRWKPADSCTTARGLAFDEDDVADVERHGRVGRVNFSMHVVAVARHQVDVRLFAVASVHELHRQRPDVHFVKRYRSQDLLSATTEHTTQS